MSHRLAQHWQKQAAVAFSLIFGLIAIFVAIQAIMSATSGWLRVLGLSAIGLQFLWVSAESLIARRERQLDFTASDGYSMEIYASSRFIFVVVTMACFTLTSPKVMLVSILVTVAGILGRMWAIRQLGRFYSHRVRKQTGHQVITDGPYRYIRHPAYLGMLVANLGLLIGFPSVAGALVFALLFVPAIVYRIKREDVVLNSIPGYAAYAASTKKLLPGIW